MDGDLAKARDLASRAREMARYALSANVKKTLLDIAADYDRLAAAKALKKEAKKD